jgi:hypothetical protein
MTLSIAYPYTDNDAATTGSLRPAYGAAATAGALLPAYGSPPAAPPTPSAADLYLRTEAEKGASAPEDLYLRTIEEKEG